MTAAPTPQHAPPAPPRAGAPARPPDIAQPVGATGAPKRVVARLQPMPTPRMLRLLLGVCIVTTLLFGAVSGGLLLRAQYRMGEAARSTDQVLRVQTIRAELLRADATVSNSFLLGGQEQASQLARYQAALERAEQLLIEAADAEPADRDALTRANIAIVRYAGTVEVARAYERQGFPVGQAYLESAGSQLRAEILPTLESLADSNSSRLIDNIGSEENGLVEIGGILALAALVGTMVLTAARFRRLVNPGLAAATVLVLSALLMASMTMGNNAMTGNTVERESVATARAAANARAHAYDAKVYENLTLIARSGGGRLEEAWADASWDVRRDLRAIPDSLERERLTALWDQHSFVHLRLRTADAAGRWDAARDLATNAAPNGSNATFARFDTEISALMTDSGERAATSLRNQRGGLTAAAVLSMLAALGAVAGAIWGIRTRLREYA